MEPLRQEFELHGADEECRMLGVCIQAMYQLRDEGARNRVAEYLVKRFGPTPPSTGDDR